ncbi:TlpA disulfide reductase family protein [Nocardioides zeae]|uniref:TlpA disulfide reductase family protein n=1 Tax=Nocardioides imazamoxiresistens TaxID=3231893 RepID=A0ABU3PZP9_9ACTN|nr:TlpA disulfide reductase family protein [Nocardioides zeae]MDT9594738.1 TlpA disulfide reductase family protein [Nocardioides zeae]
MRARRRSRAAGRTRHPAATAGVTAAALALLLGACAPSTVSEDPGDGGAAPEGTQPPAAGDVAVDTPQLRGLRDDAGVEACVPGEAEPGSGGLPELALPCLGGGETVDLSTLRGPMVVNVWASWCGPCREEMPVFQEFHETYGDQVAVLGVDFDDARPEAALELMAETGATYPSLADPGRQMAQQQSLAPALRALPVTILLDADGQVASAQAIAVDDLDELVGLVEENLGELS